MKTKDWASIQPPLPPPYPRRGTTTAGRPYSDEEGPVVFDFAGFACFAPLRETGFVTSKNAGTKREYL